MVISRYLQSIIGILPVSAGFYFAKVDFTFEDDEDQDIKHSYAQFKVKASSPELAKCAAIRLMDEVVIYGNLLSIDDVTLRPTTNLRVWDAEGE